MASKSLKEIGQKLKLSRFTVARVLRNEKYVSERTRRLVLNHLKREPYIPNVCSALLSSGKTNFLGLVCPGDAFFSMEFYLQEIIRGVTETARQEGYQPMVFSQETFDSLECQKLYLSRLIGGFILPAIGAESHEGILELRSKQIPLVLLCSHLKGVTSFDCDNAFGGYLATKHLLSTGRERIAFIHAHKNWIDVEDRFQGYQKALKEAGKPARKEYVQYNRSPGSSDYEKLAVKKLLSLPNPPDAIFVANDRMALAVMSAIQQAGKKIPEDIAVIGFDDIPSCRSFSPPLSTLAQPVKEMAREATKSLIKMISLGEKTGTRFFKPKLVVRESSSITQH